MTGYIHITIDYSFRNKIATITLRRPEVHNAFNAQLIQDLTSAFTALASDEQLHGVVLAAEGQSFSAGADIQMMKEAISFSAGPAAPSTSASIRSVTVGTSTSARPTAASNSALPSG